MKKIYSPFLFILLYSCSGKISYVGQAAAPTTRVDVYINEASIRRNYEFVGQGYLNIWAAHLKPDKIQKLVEQTAKKKGANAVIISDYYIPNTGQTINTTYKTDSVGKGTVTTGNTTVTPTSSSGFRVFFIKYIN